MNEAYEAMKTQLGISHLLVREFGYHAEAGDIATATVTFYDTDLPPSIDPFKSADEAKPRSWYGQHSGSKWFKDANGTTWFPPNRYIGECPSFCVRELMT